MPRLLLYRFGASAHFEGQLVGALERIEAGGRKRILDALFIARDASGELAVIELAGNASGGIVTTLLDFRLDPAARRRVTERALARPGAETLRDLGAALNPGSALAAVLVEHARIGDLADAVARIGGTTVVDELVEATTVSDAGARLLAALRAYDRLVIP